MPSTSISFLMLLLCIFFAGCRGSRTGLEKFLPPGVSLSSRLPLNTPYKGNSTVEQELKRIGAHVKDDKLCDASGKEIKIVVFRGIGTPPGRVYERYVGVKNAEVEELRKHYTVIELYTFAQ